MAASVDSKVTPATVGREGGADCHGIVRQLLLLLLGADTRNKLGEPS